MGLWSQYSFNQASAFRLLSFQVSIGRSFFQHFVERDVGAENEVWKPWF